VYFAQKQDLLKALLRDHGCLSFVETGTYEARMTLAMADHCDVVRSIELSSALHAECVTQVTQRKFKDRAPDIKLYCGHSVERLPIVLNDPAVKRPLVWLDAHWSDGKTARDGSGSDTPIVEELKTLKACGTEGVVAIDDIRLFNGKDGYPTYAKLSELVKELWPATTLIRVDDVAWFLLT
jgi:hypothetical protein